MQGNEKMQHTAYNSMSRSNRKSNWKQTRAMELVPKERLIHVYKNLDREFSLRDLQKESLRVLYKLRRTNHWRSSTQCTIGTDKNATSTEETNRDQEPKTLPSTNASNAPTPTRTTIVDRKQGSQRIIAGTNRKIKQAAWMEAYKTKRNYTVNKPTILKAKKSSF